VVRESFARVNARNESGFTPLHTDNPAVVMVLLAAGADAVAHNAWRETPWDYAQENDTLKGTDAYWLLNEARFR